jgi:hypothetical protein
MNNRVRPIRPATHPLFIELIARDIYQTWINKVCPIWAATCSVFIELLETCAKHRRLGTDSYNPPCSSPIKRIRLMTDTNNLPCRGIREGLIPLCIYIYTYIYIYRQEYESWAPVPELFGVSRWGHLLILQCSETWKSYDVRRSGICCPWACRTSTHPRKCESVRTKSRLTCSLVCNVFNAMGLERETETVNAQRVYQSRYLAPCVDLCAGRCAAACVEPRAWSVLARSFRPWFAFTSWFRHFRICFCILKNCSSWPCSGALRDLVRGPCADLGRACRPRGTLRGITGACACDGLYRCT